ncbi:hypothetical protein [Phytoactinopolyspora mesophila]|uniref:Uncharacterized protein n=1 Tax=Phytoactinopolyspora mesophila TaxID=2650750 RepID=A0A7K3M6Y6_9ACTN|nr:hypothetical protein [Phytoactinopolyspora mesophila]NDL59025.1 hypothetical protein [Phytoactinopolyspora mesophila]
MSWYLAGRRWSWTVAVAVVIVPAASVLLSTSVTVPRVLSGPAAWAINA